MVCVYCRQDRNEWFQNDFRSTGIYLASLSEIEISRSLVERYKQPFSLRIDWNLKYTTIKNVDL